MRIGNAGQIFDISLTGLLFVQNSRRFKRRGEENTTDRQTQSQKDYNIPQTYTDNETVTVDGVLVRLWCGVCVDTAVLANQEAKERTSMGYDG